MSTAFEVTPDDVSMVMQEHGKLIRYNEAERLFADHIISAAGRIEKAALRGFDMTTQTDYAYSEIRDILKENGIL